MMLNHIYTFFCSKYGNEKIYKLFNFFGVGILSIIINFSMTIFMCEILGVHEEIAYLMGLFSAMICNFLLLRFLVFKSHSINIFRQFFAFVISSITFRGFEYLGFLLLHTFMGFWYIGSMLVVQFVSFFIKFYFMDSVIFNKKLNA